MNVGATASADERRPPLWWTLIRHEWRLTMRDFFNVAGRKLKGTAAAAAVAKHRQARRPVGLKRRVAGYVVGIILLHVFGLVVLFLPKHWHDTVPMRIAAVSAIAFLFTFMLSYTMSRVVTAFHERRDLDLLLSAPVPAAMILTIRSLTVAVAATVTFAIFVFPFADVGVITGRWWTARIYIFLPLLALLATSIALTFTDVVVRLIGVRRARVGLQIFSSVIGASVYLVSQSRQFLPADFSARMTRWFMGLVRIDDAPWPIAFIAALADGDPLTWLVFVVAVIGLFVAAVALSRRRFVAVAQMPEGTSRAARAPRTTVERRFAKSFTHRLFTTLLIKEWRLLLRAPQLISQVLLQMLYLMPMLFVAFSRNGLPSAWSGPTLAAGIVGVTGTLATSLAWITVVGEDAPDLLNGSPRGRGVILSAKLLAAVMPPILFIVIATIGMLQRSIFDACVVLLYGVLTCASAVVLSGAAPPSSGKRTDFQKRYKGRRVSTLIEALHFFLWAGAAAAATGGYWIIAPVLTLLALVLPAVRLPRALKQMSDDD
jgi:ABC-2 type transport system permease protein